MPAARALTKRLPSLVDDRSGTTVRMLLTATVTLSIATAVLHLT